MSPVLETSVTSFPRVLVIFPALKASEIREITPKLKRPRSLSGILIQSLNWVLFSSTSTTLVLSTTSVLSTTPVLSTKGQPV